MDASGGVDSHLVHAGKCGTDHGEGGGNTPDAVPVNVTVQIEALDGAPRVAAKFRT